MNITGEGEIEKNRKTYGVLRRYVKEFTYHDTKARKMEFKKFHDFEAELKRLNNEKKRIISQITPTNITPPVFQYILHLFDTIKKTEQDFVNYLNKLNNNRIQNLNTRKIIQYIYNNNISLYEYAIKQKNELIDVANMLINLKNST